MKSIITATVLALAFITTSCNKEADWMCTCTIDGKKTDAIMFDIKKKEAKKRCKDLENNTYYDVKNCGLSGKEK